MSSQARILSKPSGNPPLSAADSPASRTVLQANVERLVMNVISQENSKESFGRLNPDGSLLKMSRGYAQANLGGFLESSFMTFPKWGILSGGVVGGLSMSEPAIGENGSSSLPTIRANERGAYQRDRGIKGKERPTLTGKIELLPTLMAHNLECAGKEYCGTRHALKLHQAINLLPTPTSRDHKDTGKLENVPVNALLGRELGKNHGLKLQPAFAEWMMGFPEEWTALDASEMQLYLPKSTRSSKRL